jgi:hypothetical protein
VAGEVVSQFEDPDGDSYDVRLRVDPVQRTQTADLLGMDLPGRDMLVPLSSPGCRCRLSRSGSPNDRAER